MNQSPSKPGYYWRVIFLYLVKVLLFLLVFECYRALGVTPLYFLAVLPIYFELYFEHLKKSQTEIRIITSFQDLQSLGKILTYSTKITSMNHKIVISFYSGDSFLVSNYGKSHPNSSPLTGISKSCSAFNASLGHPIQAQQASPTVHVPR